jgi:CubicO group peptidase (beta-lactamase class C family)
MASEVIESQAVVILEEKAAYVDFDLRLTGFLDFAEDLQRQGLLDGEILVVRDGNVLLSAKSEDIGEEPQFMIGSVSKQFFAVALLKALYESSQYKTEKQKIADVKEKLHLSISQFLPEESKIWNGEIPGWAQEISLHHLLTHTSGILNYTNIDGFHQSNPIDANKLWFESYRSTNEIIKLVSKEPLSFPSGSKYSYCNTGYVIIAEVIEAITSMSASQYIQQALFDPIGLSSTINPDHGRWDELQSDPKLSRLLSPLKYDPREDFTDLYPLLHCEDISVAKGAGSIISTAKDLLMWNLSLHKDGTILPEELYTLFITPNLHDYAYGITIKNNDIGLIYGHSGGIDSYRTYLLYMPEIDVSVILLSNICYDFDKIKDEFNALVVSLQDTIADEKERNEAAKKIINEKYPFKRGFALLMEELGKVKQQERGQA